MEKKSPAKASIQYGVIFGVIMILELVISFSFNLGPEDKFYGILLNSLNFLILPFTFIYLACNNYKNNFNNGFINISECLKIGLSVAVIAVLISSLFSIIFNFIFPEYMSDIMELAKEKAVKDNRNASPEQLKTMLWVMDFMTKQYILIPVSILMNCFIALIHSLIVGVIVKKDTQQSF